jgi:hypothetical protein
MMTKESGDWPSQETIANTAAVAAIGGLLLASSVPIIGIPLAVGGAGVAAYELYRKLSEEEDRTRSGSE